MTGVTNVRKDTLKIQTKMSTKFVAHRGVSGLECENTAAAFLAAGNRTYYGVETDIYRTSDGEYICHHDGSTGRICDTDLPIEASTLNELRSLTLRDTDGASDRAEIRLATPYEYMKICRKYGKVCVAELKSNFTLDEIKEIIAIFENGGHLDSTVFIAFNIENLKLVKSVKPSQACQFLTGKWNDSLPETLSRLNMSLDIHHSELTEERIAACHEKGVEVNCWTVDSPERAELLISWGVDYITTNILE